MAISNGIRTVAAKPTHTPTTSEESVLHRLEGSNRGWYWDSIEEDWIEFRLSNYLVYTFYLTQTGTSAPVIVVLENTIGDVEWSRENVDSYRATLPGAFVVGSTWLSPASGPNVTTVDGSVAFVQVDESYIDLLYPGNEANGSLADSPFFGEIRVYQV